MATEHRLRRSVHTAGALLYASALVVACSGESSPPSGAGERSATSSSALGAAPAIDAFALYAERSVRLGEHDSIVGGDVGVHARKTQSHGPQLTVSKHSHIERDRALIAPSVALERGAIVGYVETDSIQNRGGHVRAVAPFPSSMPPLPLALAPTAGGRDVAVHRSRSETLTPGAYGTLEITGALWLEPGAYSFSRITVEDGGRLLAKRGGVELRVEGTFKVGRNARVAPIDREEEDDSAAGRSDDDDGDHDTRATTRHASASEFLISVSSRDPSEKRAAVAIGADSVVRCLLAAPHGTVSLDDGVLATGALVGFDIIVGDRDVVTFQDGFAPGATGQTGLQAVALGYGGPPYSTAPVIAPVSATTPIHLSVGLPVTDLAGLQALVQQVSDPSSPQYRQYLDPGHFASRFSAPQNYPQLRGWAQAVGLTVTAQFPNNLALSATGPAAVVEQALHLNLNRYLRPDGSEFYAPDRDPSLDLGATVLAFEGLDNYIPPRTAMLPDGFYFGSDFRTAYASCNMGAGGGESIGIFSEDAFFADDILNFEDANPQFSSAARPLVEAISADGFPTTPPPPGCICPGTQSLCGGACSDTTTNPSNCGACGTACPQGQVCTPTVNTSGATVGSCAASCGAGLTLCNGRCVDLSSSPNCGFCGQVCDNGSSCVQGLCACAPGQESCGGTCADTSSDARNCGGCGRQCRPGLVCNSGSCQATCARGLTTCNGRCVNLQGDSGNCGSCGTVCGNGTQCATGSGTAAEVSLDIQMTLSMAPQASVFVFEGYGPAGILAAMATHDPLPHQLTTSYGYCGDPLVQELLYELAVQGQSFFQASGDHGAYGTMPDPNFVCPYADAATWVGGTYLNLGGNPETWLGETGWPGSGGGIILDGPIPPYQSNLDMSQSGGSRTRRNVPDVAMNAGSGVEIYFANVHFGVGGTSVATPLWAGFTALVNERNAGLGLPPVGFLNPALYALAQAGAMPVSGACLPNAFFHDICDGASNASRANPVGYSAVAGYDLVTGWGSPKCALISELACPTRCSGSVTCVHLDTDSNNCGACGNACPSFESCFAGICQLVTGFITTPLLTHTVNGFSDVILTTAEHNCLPVVPEALVGLGAGGMPPYSYAWGVLPQPSSGPPPLPLQFATTASTSTAQFPQNWASLLSSDAQTTNGELVSIAFRVMDAATNSFQLEQIVRWVCVP